MRSSGARDELIILNQARAMNEKSLLNSVSRSAIVTALSAATFFSMSAQARDVGGGENVVVDGREFPPVVETWFVKNGGKLSFVHGAKADGVHNQYSFLTVQDSEIVATTDEGVRLTNGANALIERTSISSPSGLGLALTGEAMGPGWGIPSKVVVNQSDVRGFKSGALVNLNSELEATATRFTGTKKGAHGFWLLSGTATLSAGSETVGEGAGVWVSRDWRDHDFDDAGRRMVLDNSTIRGGATGILSNSISGDYVTANIALRNGSRLLSDSGMAIDVRTRTHLDVSLDASTMTGDVRIEDGASANIAVNNGSSFIGNVLGNANLTFAGSGYWVMTGDSVVSGLSLDAGVVRLAEAGNAMSRAVDTYQTLRVNGNFGGSGGELHFRTVMNEGGPLSSQFTDRLLIDGNVSSTGVTYVSVTPTGDGALTDLNGNGKVDANEGISLIQVAGNSYKDAFAVRGGYVAAGPWQYTIHAFGPGQTDPSQSVLPVGSLNWDYRLASATVCEDGCTPEPPDPPGPDKPDPPGPDKPDPPGPDKPDPPRPGVRPAVVPQLPSYLSAPVALLGYGELLNSGLHQRLGDIRMGRSSGSLGGEVFARYVGSQLQYSPNRSFQDYGYHFDQQINALQLGGSLIAIDANTGTLRAGWAADHGTTRVTPNAADGKSRAKYTGNGLTAWVTWEHGQSGLWIDGVVASERYRGDVGTDARGEDVARIRASGTTISVEAGLPMAVSDTWTVEPHVQASYQQIAFRDFTDKDGLEYKLGSARQASIVMGAMVARHARQGFLPYARLDLVHTVNGDPWVGVSSKDWNVTDRFRSGRTGNGYQAAAGLMAQLGKRVHVYAEGNYRHSLGSYGVRGWSANAGLRINF